MVDIKLKNEIIKHLDDLDIPYGFTPCRRFKELIPYFKDKFDKNYVTEFEDKDIEKRINPFLYYEEGKSIISIGVPYYRENEPYNNMFSKYTQGDDYHYIVKDYLDSICKILCEFGYEYKSFCDTNNLPERYISYLCGVGHIGRNSLIYTKKYGSYVFLGEIITNAKLIDVKEDGYYQNKFDEISLFKECGICRKCLYKCPNKVLFDKDFKTCVSNLTQQKSLSKEEINGLNSMIFGCDICQDNCPKNKNICYSNEEKFNVHEFIRDINEDQILNMDNKFFKENFKKLSCSWRGKKTLIRNAMIRYKGDKNVLGKLKFGSGDLNYYRDLFLKDFEE